MKSTKSMLKNILCALALIVLPPLLIQIACIKGWWENTKNGLNAADVLNYVGTVLGVGGTIFAAIFAFFHERELQKKEQEEAKRQHLDAIKPSLSICIKKEGKKTFLIVTSRKEADALYVHIEDQFLFSTVKFGKEKRRRVTFDAVDNDKSLYLYSLAEKLEENDLPPKLTLYYMDIDHHTIEQSYVYSSGGNYIADGESCYL